MFSSFLFQTLIFVFVSLPALQQQGSSSWCIFFVGVPLIFCRVWGRIGVAVANSRFLVVYRHLRHQRKRFLSFCRYVLCFVLVWFVLFHDMHHSTIMGQISPLPPLPFYFIWFNAALDFLGNSFRIWELKSSTGRVWPCAQSPMHKHKYLCVFQISRIPGFNFFVFMLSLSRSLSVFPSLSLAFQF